MTAKTGEPLKFNKFAEVLVSSLQKSTEEFGFDVLTFSDLEEMRSGRKVENTGHSTSNSSTSSGIGSGSLNSTNRNTSANRKKERRYVIISKTNEKGEKVHYPLSLNVENVDDIAKLKE